MVEGREKVGIGAACKCMILMKEVGMMWQEVGLGRMMGMPAVRLDMRAGKVEVGIGVGVSCRMG